MNDYSLGLSWKVDPSKNGMPWLSIGERAVHSAYDPMDHAQKVAEQLIARTHRKGCDSLLLIGAGLDYLPNALKNQGCSFAVWEPFPELRIQWPTQETNTLPIYHSLEDIAKTLSSKTFARPEVVIHPGYEPYCRLEYISLLHHLQDKQRICSPVSVRDTVITQRSLDTLKRLPWMKTMGSLQNRHNGETAFLISPGASLRAALPAIRANKKAILIAALQAVPLLQKEGICIDYAVVADPNDFSNFTSACDTNGFSALLLESAVDPALMDWQPEKTYLFHYATNYLHQLGWALSGVPSIRAPLATVSETLLHLASGMGFQEMVLIGMDFCWLEERYSYRATGAIDSMTDRSEKRFQVKTASGAPAWTETAYYQAARYLSVFCPFLSRQGIKVLRFGEGLAINGTENVTIDELAHCGRDRKQIKAIDEKPIPLDKIEKIIKEASLSTHAITIKEQYSSGVPVQKQMPFFDEIPVKERAERCLKALSC